MNAFSRCLAAAGLAAATLSSAAQSQQECAQVADERLTQVLSATAQAGSITQRQIVTEALSCMQSGNCTKPEYLLFVQEIMVDDQMVAVQREKVQIMRRLVQRANVDRHNVCLVADLLPSTLAEIEAANAKQFARVQALTRTYFDSRSRKTQ